MFGWEQKLRETHAALLEKKNTKIEECIKKHNYNSTPNFVEGADIEKLSEEEVNNIIRPKKQKKGELRKLVYHSSTILYDDISLTLYLLYISHRKKA